MTQYFRHSLREHSSIAAHEEPQVAVEIRHYRNSRADLASVMQFAEAVEKLGKNSRGILITSGQLTSVTRELLAKMQAEGINIEVIDGSKLRTMLLQYPELVDRYFGDEQ